MPEKPAISIPLGSKDLNRFQQSNSCPEIEANTVRFWMSIQHQRNLEACLIRPLQLIGSEYKRSLIAAFIRNLEIVVKSTERFNSRVNLSVHFYKFFLKIDQ